MLTKIILLLSFLNINSFNLPSPKITRRGIISSSILTLPLSVQADELYTEKIDWLAHWSFFGLAPPPIERKITYDELLKEIKSNKIKSLQIAVQHDCVIATTNEGHRLSLLLPDEKFDNLVMDSIDKKGNQMVNVLPIDPIKAKIRDIAQITLVSICSFYLAVDLGILDYDLTSYSSIKEREDAIANGKKPKKLLKSIITKLLENKETNTTDYDKELNKVLGINNKTKI